MTKRNTARVMNGGRCIHRFGEDTFEILRQGMGGTVKATAGNVPM